MAGSISPHARNLLVLGLPLIGGNVAQMALHVCDTLLMGRYGVVELAALVIASSSWFVVFILGSGFAHAVMPLVAASLGSGDETQVRRDTRMGLWLSAIFGFATYPLFWFSQAILLDLGQKPEVAALGQDFLRIAAFGMVPALMVAALRSYLAALGRTQVVLWVTLAGVGVNLVLAWVLIFGRLGAPELGVRGAALASVTVQVLTLVVMVIYALRLPELQKFHLFQRFWKIDQPAMARVFRLGWPIGVTGLAESGLFQATALMMGWIGTVELAAHGIVMQAAALAFVVHLGLSNATTVLTGRAAGAGEPQVLRDGAKAAIALSLGFGVLIIVLFLALPVPILSAFIDTTKPEAPAILAFGTLLLAMAALFQIADAMQVMALGLLRGIQDTRVPMIAATVSYWLIGIPASYVLAFPLGWGGVGLWSGLTIGLVAAAASMMWRFWDRAPKLSAQGQA